MDSGKVLQEKAGEVEVFSPGSRAPGEFVERELLLVKVRAGREMRGQVLELAGVFRARVLHIDGDSLILEATGAKDKIEAMEDVLEPFGIVARARTGLISLRRRD